MKRAPGVGRETAGGAEPDLHSDLESFGASERRLLADEDR